MNPLVDAQPLEGDERSFEGVVRQRLAAGSYAYLEIDADRATRWVATMGSGEPPGTRVHVRGFATRQDFRSRRLGRRFERLVFGIVEDQS